MTLQNASTDVSGLTLHVCHRQLGSDKFIVFVRRKLKDIIPRQMFKVPIQACYIHLITAVYLLAPHTSACSVPLEIREVLVVEEVIPFASKCDLFCGIIKFACQNGS